MQLTPSCCSAGPFNKAPPNLCYSPNWASPERILGSAIGESCEHRVSALALDVWSLECFMFFLISGSPPFSAKGTNFKQCLADVCALHWQWVGRTPCFAVHMVLQAAHTWVCVHLVCRLDFQVLNGWTTCTSWKLCTVHQMHTWWTSLPMPVHMTLSASRRLSPDGVQATEHQWACLQEETYKEGNGELLSPDVHPMLDISAYVGN